MVFDEKDLIYISRGFLKEQTPRGQTPTHKEVEGVVRKVANTLKTQHLVNVVVEEILTTTDTRVSLGECLSDNKAKHDSDWVNKSESNWEYWDDYGRYLASRQGWNPEVVHTLGDVTKRILGHLQDPHSEGSWNRRGLVIGDVQSGKTANYIGLVAKAADAGYRFFVVIAGIHNNLRRQTQERIEEGFIGNSIRGLQRVSVGVGKSSKDKNRPITFTSLDNDFNRMRAESLQFGLEQITNQSPLVLVIKKNVNTLRALHEWLTSWNAERNGKIEKFPLLMIDDEADYASINTRREEHDPTKTNKLIRKILSIFDKSSFVGYTATPFANIFINPDSYDESAKEDLFPRDFIYCLDAPTSYFGADKVFLEDESSDRILNPITDAEPYIRLNHKKKDVINDLPSSLSQAVIQFVLIRTIRNLRGHNSQPCSMMVNVSRFTKIQREVKNKISYYLDKLRKAVKAHYRMPDESVLGNTHMQQFKKIFSEEFGACEFGWSEVKATLLEAFKNMRVLLINSDSEDALDYKKHNERGNGFTPIVVGGFSLSRGLTIEGLSLSYVYRNTRTCDTLMQMGRWFGYRIRYDDLCRVCLSYDSIDWYAYVAKISEELRQQIKRMCRDGRSPSDFGLYIESHPDTLLITSANKMMHAMKIDMQGDSFNGSIQESYILPVDEEKNKDNEKLIQGYWKSGFGKGQGQIEKTPKGCFIRDVPTKLVVDFLQKFYLPEEFQTQKLTHSSYLESISEKHETSDIVLISLNGVTVGSYELGCQERRNAEENEARTFWRLRKCRVASRGDEKLGLTDEQKEAARKDADQNNKKPSDIHYRTVRNKPLLMLHSLRINDKEKPVYAYGISFPPGTDSKKVAIFVNTTKYKELFNDGPVEVEEECDA